MSRMYRKGNLMNIDDFENNFFKKQNSHTDYIIECENGFKLPSKRLFELKSHGDMSCLEIGLNWLSQAQKRGITVFVDCEFNCPPETMKKHNIDLSELLYVPAGDPDDFYNMMNKLLGYKELRLIVLSTAQLLFPLIYDMKEFTEKIYLLKDFVQQSNASVIILNPYYTLSCDIFNKIFFDSLGCRYKTRGEKASKIEVFSQKSRFLFEINHNHI